MTTKKMKRILITEDSETANNHLAFLRNRALKITKLIKSFNSLLLLAPLENQEEVTTFLKDPISYFEDQIIKYTGADKAYKITPDISEIARFFHIPYDLFVSEINEAQVNSDILKFMRFNGLIIEFDQTKEKEIRESFFKYSTSQEENKAVIEARKVCDVLNRYCEQMDISSSDMNQVANNLGLKCELKPGGHSGWVLKENMDLIRAKIKYKKDMAGIE